LTALWEHGSQPDKCELGRHYIEYIGHVVEDCIVAVPKHRVLLWLLMLVQLLRET